MSEFAIDRTSSHPRTITSICHPSPAKQLSEEFITAKGSSGTQFGTVQPCSESEFETMTICPPSTDYDDARKCDAEEQTPESWTIVLLSPTMSPSAVSSGPEPDVYKLSPPLSEYMSVTLYTSPQRISEYTPSLSEHTPTERTLTEWPLTEYPPSEAKEHESPCAFPPASNMMESNQGEEKRTRAGKKNASRRLKKRLSRAEQDSSSASSVPIGGASSDADLSATEVDMNPNAGSKRTTTHEDAPSSPEQPHRPSQKRSRVKITLDPDAILLSDLELNSPGMPELDAQDPTKSTQIPGKQPKPTHRGARGGMAWKAQLAKWKQSRMGRDLRKRGDIAKKILQTLRFLGKEVPLPKEIDELSPEEAINFAKDHRVNEKENIYVFNAAKQAESWRKKNNVKPGQFEDTVLTEDDLKKYNFRIFDNGKIYAFEYDENGKEELVFSAVFIPFSEMDKDELNDFEFLGKYFADRRDHRDGYIDTNSAHKVEGAEGIMLAFGWRADTHAKGGFRLGVYSEHKGTCWVDSHGKHYRMAKIYSRMFHKQAPLHHGAANDYINTQRLPRLDDQELGATTGAAPASNLTCTCNDFCNGIHRDKDAHRWTFGIWFPTYKDGRLVLNAEEVRNMTQGGQFALPDHGFAVDFGNCPGVIALTWRGPIDLHGTVKSKTKEGYVRWGSSIQCTNRLKQRTDLHWKAVEERNKTGRNLKTKLLKINDWFRRSGTPREKEFSPEWYEKLWDGVPTTDGPVEDNGEIEILGVPEPEPIDESEFVYDPDVTYDSESDL
ncbi:hypothetical protein FRC11_007387 [Ceratobasidium sp. 423]|nr:hypothetical protein FRC11_007387 [Ceratobasidium sp. 423]